MKTLTNSTTVTNTFIVPDEKISITGTKIWNDNSNESGKRDSSVTLQVKRGNAVVAEGVANDANGWKYTFTNLPKYDSLGNEITYTIDEADTGNNFYTKSTSGTTVTNTFVVPGEKVEVEAIKVWDDNENVAKKRPSSVTLQVKDGDTVVAEQSVTSANGWKHTFTNLPKYDSLGNEVSYTVDEVDIGSKFYTKSIAGNTITNTFLVPDEKVSITGVKRWNDNSNAGLKRDTSITLQVKNGSTVVAEQVISEADGWKYTFTNLPKYDNLGNEIVYTIDEKDTGNKFYTKTLTNSTTVTNTFVVPNDKVSVIGTKVWNDNNNTASKRPTSVTLQVKNGNTIVSTGIVNEANGWKYTFDNLAKYDSLGNEITYTIDEVDIGSIFYNKNISGNTITNTFVVPDEKISVTGIKVWNDDSNASGKRPSSVILQIKNGTTIVQEGEVNEANGWIYTFSNLPKYDSLGNEIKYTVDEKDIGSIFYTKTLTNSTTVTNTFVVPNEKVSVVGTKVWNDNNNEAEKRPTSITLQVKNGSTVVADAEVNEANGWKYTFSNLAKYDSLGNVINYTIDEVDTGNKFYTKTLTNATTVTNTFVVPDEKVSVVGTKVWDDNNNVALKRPSSVTLQVKNGSTVVAIGVVNDANGWKYTFTNLAKYDRLGNEITYTIDEADVGSIFYKKTLTNSTTVTNTFVVPTDKVSVIGTKIWEDNNNLAGKRPSSVTLQVKNGSTVVQEGVVNEANGWKYTFNNLPKYDSLGNVINYTIDEKDIGSIFYKKTLTNSTTVTNTFVVPDERISITGTKIWDDNENIALKRDTSVTLQVKNGSTVVATGVVNEANGWKYTFSDLPRYDSLGNDINYTVDEVDTGNTFYTKTTSGTTVTNSFIVPGEKVEVTGTKIWNDNNNLAGKRPSSITLQIKNGEQIVAEQEVSEANGWKYTFSNLAKYDNLGNEIAYTVDEKSTGSIFYTKELTNSTTVTDTFVVPDEKVEVTGTKVWSDNNNINGKRPSSVVLQVKNGSVVVQDAEVNATNGWKYTFTDLPKYDSLGNVINYTIDEEDTGSIFYTKTLTNSTTVTNTFEVPNEKVEVTGTKVWDDNNNASGKRPGSVVLQVKDGTTVVAEQEVNSSNGWKYTFTNLPKYREDGSVIVYTIDEADIGNKFYTKTLTNNTTVTNTFVVPDEKVTVTGTKIWDDNNDAASKRPTSVTLQVKNGTTVVTEQVVNSANGWKYTFSNLPKYDSLGNEIVYTIDEVDIGSKFYTKTLTNSTTVTNTFVVPNEKVEVTGTKVWSDNENIASKRPSSITLQVKNGGTVVAEQVISEADGWKYTFSNLPKYDSLGNEITYTIDEVNIGSIFYTKTLTNATTVTNTFVVPDEKISITGTKIWNDNNNESGKRDASVTLQVKRGNSVVEEGVANDANAWSYTFSNLPKYDNLGNEILYTIDEKDTGNSFYTKSTSGNVVTNTFVVPGEKVEVEAIKVWNDNENEALKRPSSVILQVKNGDNVVLEQSVSSANSWKHTFTNLPKYDSLGNEISYTVDEVDTGSKFYTKSISGNTITNTFVVPDERISITGTKVWNDNENIAGKRPSSITLQVKNGSTVVSEQVINSTSGWSYTFSNLPKYDSLGNEITYTIDEADVGSKFYTKTLTNATTVTNTFVVPDEKVAVTEEKVWNDNGNSSGKRPSIVTLQVKNGTTVVAEQSVSEANNWKYTFENLAKYDSLGNEIAYTVDEVDIGSEFYSKVLTDNSTVTNTFVVPGEKISITGTKIWNDNNNIAGKRPTSVTLQVKNGTTIVAEEVVSEANGWKYPFNNLSKYDSLGNEIAYTIDEKETGSIFYTKTLTNSTTVTNTFIVPDEKVEVIGTKVWNDNENVAGKRPESVTLQVKNGSTVVATGVANEASGWKYTFSNLPKYDSLGNVINYTIDEVDIGSIFYTKTLTNKATVTNTFIVPDEKISITGTKVWDDNENVAGKRPTNVTLQVKNGGTIVAEQVVSETDGWKYTFNNLPKYDSLGNEIAYIIDEKDIGSIFYTKTLTDNVTVTNTFVVPDEKISITGTKVWNDNNNASGKRDASVTLQVKIGNAVVSEGVVNETNSWSYTFSNLAKYDNLGNVINYTIDEKDTGNSFYTKSTSGTTVTNTFIVPGEKVELEVIKAWNDNENAAKKRDTSVILQVKDGSTVVAEQEVNEANGWKHTFTNLPKYDGMGNQITYTVDEVDTGNKFYSKSISGNVITNTFVVPDEKISITGTKVWDDDGNVAGKRPTNVTLQVKNGSTVVAEEVVNEANGWSYTFSNLTKYDSLGNEITYTIDEVDTGSKFYTKILTDNVTVTNIFVVPNEKVSVTGTKVWNDSGNAAGKRPSNVTLQVKNGGIVVAEGVVNEANGWSYTFSNLPKYDNLGNEILYTIDEVDVGSIFYTKTLTDNITVTNTFIVPDERISITGEKVWNDNDNASGKREVSVTLQVKNGSIIVATGVANESSGWKYTFSNLPRYDDLGNEIKYMVDEVDMGNEFYTKILTNETTVTNTFVVPGEKISITGKKVWNDNGNAAQKRPASVTLQVKNGSTVVAEGNVSDLNNWEYTFNNLPKYDEFGNEITYTIDEKDIGSIFYTKELTNKATVTNTFIVPDERVSVTGTKVWDDNNNASGKRDTSVTLQLKNGDTVVAEGVVNEVNNWSYTFDNLPKYDSLGNDIKYKIDEVNTGNEFYTKELTNKATVTNTFVVPGEKVSVTGIKVWNDSNNAGGKRNASATLQVKNGDIVVAEGVANEANGWSYTFSNLAKYDEFGNEIVYTIDEVDLGNKFYTKSVSGNTITNTFVVPDEKISVTGTKIWDDDNNINGKRPTSVTLQVKSGTTVVAEGVINEANGWKYTFNDLPKYDSLGNDINYTIDEVDIGSIFYTKELTNATTVTNRFVVPGEKIEIIGTKVWDDNNNVNGKRPSSATLQVKNGSTVVAEGIVNEANGWSYTFSNLAKYDNSGNEITYTIDEVDIGSEFYIKTLTDNRTVTNKFTVPGDKIEVEVIKTWNDNNNAAGKRPTSVTLQVKDGNTVVTEAEVNETNGWKYTFNNLPKYRSDGNIISYTVDEKDLGNKFYTKSITGNVVTNTFVVPDEKMEIIGKKVWNDNNNASGKRPGSVTLQVKNGATVISEAEVNEANGWKYTFSNLAKYDSLGNEIAYTLDEVDLGSDFYTKSIVGNVVTNTFVVPGEKVEITGTKVWADNENAAGKRPATVTLQVKNGDTVVVEQEVTEAVGWTHTFTNLQKYDDFGNVINYTIDEKDTGNIFYVKTLTNATTVTDTFVVPDERISITGEKVWNDNDNEALKRPTNVTLQVKNKSVVVAEGIVNEASGWKYTFGSLPKYDDLGNEINYTIDEADIGSNFYTKSIVGNVVTNTFVVPSDKIEITGIKVWNDNNNAAGKRPNIAILQVKNGEEIVAEGEINETNGWKYTFSNLAKYDSLGNEITYTIDEVDLENKFYTKSVAGNVVTNTFVVPDEKVEITAEKVWNDNNNAAGKRPTSSTLQVKNGNTVVMEKVVSEADDWKCSFSDLAKYDSLGNEIVYTIDELDLGSIFYTKILTNATTVTNTFIVPGDRISITGTKIWNDNNNAALKRPVSVTLQLKDGEKIIEEREVNEANGWKYTFSNLPKYDSFGNEINYTIDEVDIGSKFYIKENTNATTITNTFVVPDEKIDVTGIKIWNDNNNESGKRPDTSTIIVKNGDVVVAEGEVNSTNGWKYTFSNLAKYDSLGNEITYTIDERDLGNKFYVKELTNDRTVTNKFSVPDERISVTGIKMWNDNNNAEGKRPVSITLQVKEGNTVIAEGEANEVSGWKYTFDNLPKYDGLGNERTYTIDEKDLNSPFYIKSLSGNTVTNDFIQRKLIGKLFEDTNQNGIIDGNEVGLSGFEVKLLDENLNEVFDVEGNKVEAKITDINGDYEFKNLKKGNYIVEFGINGTTYIATEKFVVDDDTINSKINPIENDLAMVDVLEGLNKGELIEIANAGIYKKAIKEVRIVGAINRYVAKEGEELEYVIRYTNDTVEDEKIEIVDDIPNGTVFAGGVRVEINSNDIIGNVNLTEPSETNNKVKIETKDGFVLRPGEEIKLIYRVRIKTLEEGLNINEITNTATVVHNTRVLSTIEAKTPVESLPRKDVDVGNNTKVKIGDTLTYIVRYKNITDEEQSIRVIDEVQEGVKYVGEITAKIESRDILGDVNITEPLVDSDSGVIEVATKDGITLKTGETIEVTYKVRVKREDEGLTVNKIINTAEVAHKTPTETVETIDVTNEVVSPLEALPVKDVDVGNKTKVKTGEVLTYIIRYKNITDEEQSIRVIDEVQEGVKYVGEITAKIESRDILGDVNITEPVVDSDRGVIEVATKDVITLKTGETIEVTYKVRVKAEEELTVNKVVNTAKVAHKAPTETVETVDVTNEVVNPLEALRVKDVDIGNKTKVKTGEVLTYIIRYKNITDEEQSVRVIDEVQEGVKYVGEITAKIEDRDILGDVNITEPVVDSDRGVIEVATKDGIMLKMGETIEITYKVRVKTEDEGMNIDKIINTAQVIHKMPTETFETVDTTNEVENPVESLPRKDVDVGNKIEVKTGDILTYIVKYTNITKDDENIVMLDEVPDGTKYVGEITAKIDDKDIIDSVNIAEPGIGSDTGKITISTKNGVTLKNGETIEITYKVRVETLEEGLKTNNVINRASVEHNGKLDVTNVVENHVETIPEKDIDVGNLTGVVEGEIVEYIIKYKNIDDNAKILRITDEVPDGTKYVGEVTAKIDGRDVLSDINVEEPRVGADSGKIEFTTKDGITLNKDEEIIVTYKVQIKTVKEGLKLDEIKNIAEVGYKIDMDIAEKVDITNEVENPINNPKKEVDIGNGTATTEGRELVYKITYKNYSKIGETIKISDVIPDGTVYVGNETVKIDGKDVLTDNKVIAAYRNGKIVFETTNGVLLQTGETIEVTFKVRVKTAEEGLNVGKIVDEAEVEHNLKLEKTNKVENPIEVRPANTGDVNVILYMIILIISIFGIKFVIKRNVISNT